MASPRPPPASVPPPQVFLVRSHDPKHVLVLALQTPVERDLLWWFFKQVLRDRQHDIGGVCQILAGA